MSGECCWRQEKHDRETDRKKHSTERKGEEEQQRLHRLLWPFLLYAFCSLILHSEGIQQRTQTIH